MNAACNGIYDIIINSTSIGITGGGYPTACVATEAAVDLQYKPAVTPFLAGVVNCPKKINGFSMLVWQACRSFAIWTGTEPKPDIQKLAKRIYAY